MEANPRPATPNGNAALTLTLAEAMGRLPGPNGARFVKMFERHDLEVEIYAPRGVDLQSPHDRDEIYIIAAGHGVFFDGADRRPYQPGDFMFVPAHMEHRFEQFSDDFAVWVIFWGPKS